MHCAKAFEKPVGLCHARHSVRESTTILERQCVLVKKNVTRFARIDISLVRIAAKAAPAHRS